MITNVLARMTPTCSDVTRLTSQSMDRSLPWCPMLKLQLHYWICEACARYRDQLRMVRNALLRSARPDASANSVPSPAAKSQLTQAFQTKRR
ncbi:anti-sigma factor family protein [Petrachloros mirabilis]